MKKLLFFLIPVFSYLNNSFAQAPNWLWAKSSGGTDYDQSLGFAGDYHGNSYVTGYFISDTIVFGNITLFNANPGTWDMFLVKYDFTGNAVWARSYGGNGTDYGQGIFSDNHGNIYITGGFASSSINVDGNILVNSNPTGFSEDILIIKLDTSGNVVWTKNLTGAKDDEGTSIAADEQGNCYVTGGYRSDSLFFGNMVLYKAGIHDVFLIKLDASGNEVWASSAGGIDYDIAYSLAVNSRGELFQAGIFYSPYITFGNSTLINQHPYFSTDIFITKYDTAGTVLWTHSYGGSDDDMCYSVAADPFGNWYTTGEFLSDTVFFDGVPLINGGENIADAFLTKMDSAGDVIWAKSAGGNNLDYTTAIASDKNGNCFVTGCYSGNTISFGNETLTNSGNVGTREIFMVNYDASGNVLMAKSIGSDDNEYPVGIAVDSSGNSYISGIFYSDTLVIGNSTLINTNSEKIDCFIAKLSPVSTRVNELNTPGEVLSAYPNPAHQTLTICHLPERNLKALYLYNIFGEKVFTWLHPFSSSTLEVDVSKFAKGIYLLQVLSGEKEYVRKIIIE